VTSIIPTSWKGELVRIAFTSESLGKRLGLPHGVEGGWYVGKLVEADDTGVRLEGGGRGYLVPWHVIEAVTLNR
jgi:hypothetical protein